MTDMRGPIFALGSLPMVYRTFALLWWMYPLPGRSAKFHCDHVIVHGEPRSGTSWTTRLLDVIAFQHLCVEGTDCKYYVNDVTPAVLWTFGPGPDNRSLSLTKEYDLFFHEASPRSSSDHEPFSFDRRDIWGRLFSHSSRECFVAVIRDPRDVVVSEAEFYIRRFEQDPELFQKDHGHEFSSPLSVKDYARETMKARCQWVALRWTLWNSLAREFPHRVHLLFYEDLKADVIEVVRKLADFVALPMPNVYTVLEHASMSRMRDNGNSQRGELKVAVRGMVGGFHEDLGPQLAEELTHVCFEYMPITLQKRLSNWISRHTRSE